MLFRLHPLPIRITPKRIIHCSPLFDALGISFLTGVNSVPYSLGLRAAQGIAEAAQLFGCRINRLHKGGIHGLGGGLFGIQRLQHARKRRAKPSKLEMQLVQVIECILQLLLLLLRAVFGWLGLGWMIAGHFCYFQGAVSRFTDSDGCKAQTDGELKLLRAHFDEWWERDEGAATAARVLCIRR